MSADMRKPNCLQTTPCRMLSGAWMLFLTSRKRSEGEVASSCRATTEQPFGTANSTSCSRLPSPSANVARSFSVTRRRFSKGRPARRAPVLSPRPWRRREAEETRTPAPHRAAYELLPCEFKTGSVRCKVYRRERRLSLPTHRLIDCSRST